MSEGKIYIFSSPSANTQATISSIYATQMQKATEFGQPRYAIFFRLGNYNLDVSVGYYTQVAGPDLSPGEVTIRRGARPGQAGTGSGPSASLQCADAGSWRRWRRNDDGREQEPFAGSSGHGGRLQNIRVWNGTFG